MPRRSHALALLLLAAGCFAAGASAGAPQNVSSPDWEFNFFNTTHVPIIRVPSFAPTVLEALGLNISGDAPQNLTHPKPIRLADIMPNLPTLPSFPAPTFGPATSEADMASNATAAAKALLVPMVESTMLPTYITALKARVADEAAWLQGFAADPLRQAKVCGVFAFSANMTRSCVALAGSMQRAKVQAISAGLSMMVQAEAQLNTDMATKLASFNIASPAALGGNWLCEVAGDLSQLIQAGATKSASAGYASKATAGLEKLRDFVAGRAASSPFWRLQDGAKVAAFKPCPIAI